MFSQGGDRKKLKICPEPPGNKLSENVYKNFVQCV
jgi:hypothetical protein